MPRRIAALVLGIAAAASAGAQTVTTNYNVSFHGHAAGALRVSAQPDGQRRASFSFRDNGRGPDLEESVRTAPDGRLLEYRVAGKSMFGAPVAESFTRADGTARWTSSVDQGAAPDDPAAAYVALNGSPEARATIARALLRSPQGRAAAYPGGRLDIRKLAETRVQAGERSAEVVLYAIGGIDFHPIPVWLRNEPEARFFAEMWPGYLTIEAGFEAEGARLLALQEAANVQLLKALAERLRHRVDGVLLIRNVRVFDAEHARLGGPSDVYVYRGRIAAILPAGSTPAGAATVIDGSGRTLLPGLFDMHAHEWNWNAALQIAGGVTTVRDLGNDNAALANLSERIDAGHALGPRIVAAGFIEGDSPHASRADFVVKSVDEAKAAVDWYAQRGARQIKLYNSMHPEWIKPVAAHAHARGLRVSGHIPAFMRAEEAVRDGFDEIQHINQVMLNFLVKPGDDTRTLLRFTLVGDKAHEIDLTGTSVRRFIALLARRGVAVDPTLAVFEAGYLQRQGAPNPSFSMVADHAPPAVQRQWLYNSMDLNDGNAARWAASWRTMLGMVARLHRAGVTLLAGTDHVAGFTLHRELELYVQAGIAPAEALRIATWNGAKVTGLAGETGSIAPGKRADLVLVDGDPTRDISAIRRISMVLTQGVMVFPAEVYEALGVRRFVDPPRIERIETMVGR